MPASAAPPCSLPPRYWAVLEPSGELVIGLAAMAVFAEHAG
ncbi:MAG: hypothetical protein R3D25_04420 [Geminicoccaceae bacterium]